VVSQLLADRFVLAIDGRLVGVILQGRPPAVPGDDQFPGGSIVAGGARTLS
jgi:hypothetical protein